MGWASTLTSINQNRKEAVMAKFSLAWKALLAVCLIGVSVGCTSMKGAIHNATAPTPAAPAAQAAGAPASAAAPAAQAASAAKAATATAPTASSPAPAAAASASGSSITEQAVGPTSVQAPFPTSRNKPQGQAWTVMKDGGYTGGLKTASQLMGLTAKQLALYESKQKAADFVTMTVPNGVVLDRLTFTRDGKHQVDIGAKVELDNPTTRLVDVYDLGGGLVVMRFHGCNNYALVRGWTQSLKPQPAPVAAPAPAAKQQRRLPSQRLRPGVSSVLLPRFISGTRTRRICPVSRQQWQLPRQGRTIISVRTPCHAVMGHN
jgi:hypothetical protein